MAEEMREIMVNGNYGGFEFSERAMRAYCQRVGKPFSERCEDPERDDPVMIEIVKELGWKACGTNFCEIVIVKIPRDVEWDIEEYDGREWVAEKHRTWHPPGFEYLNKK